MHDDDAQLPVAGALQPLGDPLDLLRRNLAVDVAVPARGVEREHQRVVALEAGSRSRAELALIARIRRGQPRRGVEQRDVVVARDRQRRRDAEPVDERARGAKLRRGRALRDVARQHHHVGRLLLRQPFERGDDRRLLGAEVRVGNLQQDGHGAS